MVERTPRLFEVEHLDIAIPADLGFFVLSTDDVVVVSILGSRVASLLTTMSYFSLNHLCLCILWTRGPQWTGLSGLL